MNTRISYLYRDADNYKEYNECIIRGTMTEDQKARIIACLEEEVYFIPSRVGMPEVKFENETEADHPWFEWMDTELTDLKATLDITVDDLVARFEKMKNGWETVRKAPTDETFPYCVTISETLSRSVIVWARGRGAAEVLAQELCNAGNIRLDDIDFVWRQCTCDGIADPNELGALEEYCNIH